MKLIKYRFLSSEINHGTEETPDIERVILSKHVVCADDLLEKTLNNVLQEAYNGEYTVEDVEPETEETTTDEVLNALLGVTE